MNGIIEHEDWQRVPWRVFLEHHGGSLPPLEHVAGDVHAYVNHGRWVADCPCGGALIVSSREPWFWCTDCGNVANDHKWRHVIFPRQKKLIETVLMARPRSDNRNWRKGGALATLRHENLVHGI